MTICPKDMKPRNLNQMKACLASGQHTVQIALCVALAEQVTALRYQESKCLAHLRCLYLQAAMREAATGVQSTDYSGVREVQMHSH